MSKLFAGALCVAVVALTATAQARDSEYHLKIEEVLNTPDFKAQLGDSVQFYFGQGASPGGASMGEFVTNRKTNSVGRADEEVCRWAMLSALISLRDRALQLGGNTVTNVVSFYKKKVFASDTEYECHAGAVVAGVALKGTIVKR